MGAWESDVAGAPVVDVIVGGGGWLVSRDWWFVHCGHARRREDDEKDEDDEEDGGMSEVEDGVWTVCGRYTRAGGSVRTGDEAWTR